MEIKQIAKKCNTMGQLNIPDSELESSFYSISDRTCKHLVFCCELVLHRLYEQFQPDTNIDELPILAVDVVLPTDISCEVFCFGVLAEFFFQIKDYVNFKMWKNRFDTALEDIRLKRGGTLPVGRWL